MSRSDIWDNPAEVQRLREEWAAGTLTEEIGRRFGVSKNAIVGKAHRLELDPRPSPIRRIRDSQMLRAALPLAQHASTLPPLASEVDAPAEPLRPLVRTDIRHSNAILLGKAARDNKPTLPPLLSDPDGALRTALTPPRSTSALVRHLAPMPTVITAPEPIPTLPPAQRSSGTCCWLLGESRPFRSCDEPAVGRGPYCDEHAKLAFVKIRREPADAFMGGDD